MRRIALALILLVGCFDNPPATYPTTATLDESKLVLGAGDKVDIVIYAGTRQSKATYALDDSGEIQLQYIGSIRAAGKTSKAVQDEIQQKLADGFMQDPIVSLTVVEINSRKLSILGQVGKTGTLRFTPGHDDHRGDRAERWVLRRWRARTWSRSRAWSVA